MKILSFGSLNIDHVYQLDHFVRPGETLASRSYQRFCGGKGLNQSVALANAGADVWHAGLIGEDGAFLRERLRKSGAKVDFVRTCSTQSGHAVIQIDPKSENCIILDGGANRKVDAAFIHEVFAAFAPGDLLLLQNEINELPAILQAAHAKGMRIAFNPAPMGPEVQGYPLNLVDIFIVNEIEAAELAGRNASGELDPEEVLRELLARFPGATIVQTLGSKGVLCRDGEETLRCPALRVKAVDTTAAGDTFAGFFLAELSRGAPVMRALKMGCAAAAITVTRPGAADSIPLLQEVRDAQA